MSHRTSPRLEALRETQHARAPQQRSRPGPCTLVDLRQQTSSAARPFFVLDDDEPFLTVDPAEVKRLVFTLVQAAVREHLAKRT